MRLNVFGWQIVQGWLPATEAGNQLWLKINGACDGINSARTVEIPLNGEEREIVNGAFGAYASATGESIA